MKNILIFLIVLFFQNLFLGQISDSTTLEYLKTQRKIYMENCKRDSLKAVEDSKTKTIYYINIPAPNGFDIIYGKELSEILKEDNIIYGGSWMGSDIIGHYSHQECYMSYMTRFAEEKFGKSYFEEKTNIALKLFLKNNPNRIFDYRSDELDYKPIIFEAKNYDEQKHSIDKFWKNYPLPKNYIKRKAEDNSYIYASFILNQEGKISNLEVEAEIQNPKNKKFQKYLEKNFTQFIKSLKWQAQTYKGYKIKSKEIISIKIP